jgi:sporulation protein YlmC with PRC-barrel domain
MTALGRQVDLGLRLLDDQLLDAEEHRCGRVDDIQLRGGPGSPTEIEALLVGPGAWTGRLRKPFAYVVDGLGPDYMRRIPWTSVEKVGTAVHLSHTAEELGLESADGRNVEWVNAPPRGTIRVSELLRSRLVTSSGEDLGRIWSVRAERQTELTDERVNEPWRVVGLVSGRTGWMERIGISPEAEPDEAKNFTPWASVQAITAGALTISDPRSR